MARAAVEELPLVVAPRRGPAQGEAEEGLESGSARAEALDLGREAPSALGQRRGTAAARTLAALLGLLGLAVHLAPTWAGGGVPAGILSSGVVSGGGASGERAPLFEELVGEAPEWPREWMTLRNVDFQGADVLQMSALDLPAVKRLVEQSGWTGFSVLGETAFLKGPAGPTSKRDLTYLNRFSGVRFFLYAQPEEVRFSAAPVCSDTPPAPGTPGAEPTVRRLDAPGNPGTSPQVEMERTLYMYRAQNDDEYSPSNVNAADIPGVLWYLQNEIVQYTPRRYDVTRIIRYKVTVRRSQQRILYENKTQFFFPGCKAVNFGTCGSLCAVAMARTGYMPGCCPGKYADLPKYWYSIPGPCPQMRIGEKTPECEAQDSGGACPCGAQLGVNNCSHHIVYAGEIRLDELVGIPDYYAFQAAGHREFDKQLDAGVGVTFWNGFHDPARVHARVAAVEDLFHRRYPDTPRTLGPQFCEDAYLYSEP